MDLETHNESPPGRSKTKTMMQRLLVALNCVLLGIGVTGAQLLTRLYYSKGGHRQWLSSWLQSGAWPLLLIPLAASYATRRARARGAAAAPVLLTPPPILLAAVGLGLISGVDNFLYAWGLEFLPVSTSAILISTQLVFTVFFAFLIVRQRLTPATVNAVVLLTVGAVVLGLHVSSDRPPGVTRGKYWLGFELTLGAALLYGVFMPLVELAYKFAAAGGGRALTYAVVMEVQLVIGFVATVFCTVGMIVNKDFQFPQIAKSKSPTLRGGGGAAGGRLRATMPPSRSNSESELPNAWRLPSTSGIHHSMGSSARPTAGARRLLREAAPRHHRRFNHSGIQFVNPNQPPTGGEVRTAHPSTGRIDVLFLSEIIKIKVA
ncbi:unnamed protein product [Urochloa decumbens]|uniref:Probable purine permease n=1 Tax=Urochloa decumbens TaxID=240449 RepID=A0ABC9FT43_9POAL